MSKRALITGATGQDGGPSRRTKAPRHCWEGSPGRLSDSRMRRRLGDWGVRLRLRCGLAWISAMGRVL
jgi:hypothetical protein